MKYTNLGIGYVEASDRRMNFPAQMREMAERIDVLIQQLADRIDALENEVKELAKQGR